MEKGIRKVFMTGATGVMGSATLKELTSHSGKYAITVLARESKRNRKKLKPYIEKGIKVLWGDLLDKNVLEEGIKDSDIILHIGGMVSPAAEHFPEKTIKVNVESMRLISGIAKKMENENPEREIGVVYVGSVSQYGSHLPPYHWGRIGDKLSAAVFDAYAYSKIMAERVLIEADLKKWVSLRQTAILHSGLLKKANDPVTFHVPLNGAIEWVTAEDSGRLMERVCRENLKGSFWNKCYNIGGGRGFRLTNYEFEKGILKAMGCPPPEKIFETNWFATDNFHGIWFEDSDRLENILHFRESVNFEIALNEMKRGLPAYFKLTSLVPAILIKKFMRRVALSKNLGTLYWLKTNNTERIITAWGGIDKYEKIPDWSEYKAPELKKDTDEKCQIEQHRPYDNSLRIEKCSLGHEYLSSEVLKRYGHGCPECLKLNTKL